MSTKRSLKGTLRTVLNRTGMASFWDTSATPDSAKDYPISLVNAIKRQIDIHISQLFRGIFGLTTPATDFVILYGGEISIAGSVYTVDSEGYAIYNGELFKINTGNATLSDTIRLVISSTEDELIRTLDIEDGTSGSGVVDYADIKRVKEYFEVDPINGKIVIGSGLDSGKYGEMSFSPQASDDLSFVQIKGKTAGDPFKVFGSGKLGLGSYLFYGQSTFTPTSSAGPSFTGLTAKGIRVGQLFYFSIAFTWNAAEVSGAGNEIGGFEYTVENFDGDIGQCVVVSQSAGLTTPLFKMIKNTKTGNIFDGGSQPTYGSLASDSFVINGWYVIKAGE